MQRQSWRHPVTQETAEVELHPGVARLLRAGTVTERRHPPDWEQEARRGAEDDLKDMQQFGAVHREFMALDGGSETGQPQAFGGKFFRAEALAAQDDMFANLSIHDIRIEPPQDETLLYNLITELQAAGFVRQTTCQPDGSPWLPPELEPWRGQLQASERGVVRLTGDASRRPALWESRLGGVPYRPLGTPWPQSKEDLRPLVFLAQLNLAELNPENREVRGSCLCSLGGTRLAFGVRHDVNRLRLVRPRLALR